MDADDAFPLVRAIAARVGAHSKAIGPFVLVGLSYAVGDTPGYSGRRDYTPTGHPGGAVSDDTPGRPARFGEAEPYRRFLAAEVLPLVARRYKVDWSRSVFVGHSYGSLPGTHILLASPEMFSRYVLSSPSLWHDHKVMFTPEQQYAAAHKDMKANVFFAVGGRERPCCGSVNDMLGDLRVFEGMDHLDVYPDMITAALKWLTADK